MNLGARVHLRNCRFYFIFGFSCVFSLDILNDIVNYGCKYEVKLRLLIKSYVKVVESFAICSPDAPIVPL